MAPSVNKPTDVKQKEADVNRKLQIYGIISAFKTGKVPSVHTRFGFTQPVSGANLPYRTTRSMSL